MIRATVEALSRERQQPSGAGQTSPRTLAGSSQDHVLKLQRAAGNQAVAGVLCADQGQPLDPATRSRMESLLGADFGGVRVHTDAGAAQSASTINARAYTTGRDIVFAAGQYTPGTPAGKRLLAHELAHVVQQSRGSISASDGSAATDRFEQEAEAAAGGALAGRVAMNRAGPRVRAGGSPGLRPAIQRSPGPAPGPAPSPPAWLGSFAAGAVHVQGDVWDIKVPSLGGDVWVGPYDQLTAFINKQGFAGKLEAAHIVGREHLSDTSSGFPGDKAPCVAVDKALHATWTKGTTDLQKGVLGGRTTKTATRPTVTTKDVTGLYNELYSAHPELREMTRNILTAPPRGMPPATSSMPRPTLPMDAHQGTTMPKPTSPMDAHQGTMPKPTSPMDAHQGTTMPKPTSPMDAHQGTTLPIPKSAAKSPQPARTSPMPAPKAAMPKPKSAAPSPTSSTEPAGGAAPKGGVKIATSTANRALGGLLRQAQTKIMDTARANPEDKDLADLVTHINTALDVKNFIENPKSFAAGAVKAALTQGVFNHFANSLEKDRASFVAEFPDVASVHADPFSNGVSLDGYQQQYVRSRAALALRLPRARKTLVYTLVLLGISDKTPEEVIAARLRQADELLAKSPDVAPYARSYYQAYDSYALALTVVREGLDRRKEKLANLPAGFAADLRRRGDALYRAKTALEDIYLELVQSPLIAFEPVEMAALEMQGLSEGFGNLATGLHSFASLAENRGREYDNDIRQLAVQSRKLADASRSLSP
jgi:hypothetical protein